METKTESYVCGFALSYDLDKYLLIDKGMKKGKGALVELRWAGVGGKIEPAIKPNPLSMHGATLSVEAETPHQAMAREFQEETGYDKMHKNRWLCFMVKEYEGIKIYMMCTFCSADELKKIAEIFPNSMGPEGKISIHNVVDVLFDPDFYTFDIPVMMNFIMRESRRGLLTKLDPEGVNSANKKMG